MSGRSALGRALLGALAVALAAPLAACSPSGPSSADDALAVLDSSIAAGDRERFDTALDRTVPQSTRDMWWSNLGRLSDVDFERTGDGWRVRWSVPGERAVATEAVSIATACAGSVCRITGIGAASGPAPAWLVEPTDVVSVDGAVLIVGRGAPDLSAAASVASSAARDAGMSLLTVDPDAPLVLEVPAADSTYALVTGMSAARTQGLGALTQREGGAPRIVVNPARAGQWSPSQANMLLTHESVHWRLSDLGAPVGGNEWVSEGLAEWLGLPRDADEAAASRARVARACRDTDGAPVLPADEQFSSTDDADALRDAYALSWAAVDELGDENGAEAAGALVEQLWTTPAEQLGGAADPLPRWCAANSS